MLRILSSLFLLLSISLSYSQSLKEDFKNRKVFRISDKEAFYILTNKDIHVSELTLEASNEFLGVLDTVIDGHFVVLVQEYNRFYFEYVSKSYSDVLIVNTSKEALLIVRDLDGGEPIIDAEITLNEKNYTYDQSLHAYVIPLKAFKNNDVLQLKTKQNVTFHQFKYSHKAKKNQLKPLLRKYEIVDPMKKGGFLAKYNRIFIALNSKQIKHNDTLEVKMYVENKRNKPYKKEVSLIITGPKYVKKYKAENLNYGSYSFSLPISDSLSSGSYTIKVLSNKKTKHQFSESTTFQILEYEKKAYTYNFDIERIDETAYFKINSVLLDQNKRQINDYKLNIKASVKRVESLELDKIKINFIDTNLVIKDANTVFFIPEAPYFAGEIEFNVELVTADNFTFYKSKGLQISKQTTGAELMLLDEGVYCLKSNNSPTDTLYFYNSNHNLISILTVNDGDTIQLNQSVYGYTINSVAVNSNHIRKLQKPASFIQKPVVELDYLKDKVYVNTTSSNSKRIIVYDAKNILVSSVDSNLVSLDKIPSKKTYVLDLSTQKEQGFQKNHNALDLQIETPLVVKPNSVQEICAKVYNSEGNPVSNAIVDLSMVNTQIPLKHDVNYSGVTKYLNSPDFDNYYLKSNTFLRLNSEAEILKKFLDYEHNRIDTFLSKKIRYEVISQKNTSNRTVLQAIVLDDFQIEGQIYFVVNNDLHYYSQIMNADQNFALNIGDSCSVLIRTKNRTYWLHKVYVKTGETNYLLINKNTFKGKYAPKRLSKHERKFLNRKLIQVKDRDFDYVTVYTRDFLPKDLKAVYEKTKKQSNYSFRGERGYHYYIPRLSKDYSLGQDTSIITYGAGYNTGCFRFTKVEGLWYNTIVEDYLAHSTLRRTPPKYDLFTSGKYYYHYVLPNFLYDKSIDFIISEHLGVGGDSSFTKNPETELRLYASRMYKLHGFDLVDDKVLHYTKMLKAESGYVYHLDFEQKKVLSFAEFDKLISGWINRSYDTILEQYLSPNDSTNIKLYRVTNDFIKTKSQFLKAYDHNGKPIEILYRNSNKKQVIIRNQSYLIDELRGLNKNGYGYSSYNAMDAKNNRRRNRAYNRGMRFDFRIRPHAYYKDYRNERGISLPSFGRRGLYTAEDKLHHGGIRHDDKPATHTSRSPSYAATETGLAYDEERFITTAGYVGGSSDSIFSKFDVAPKDVIRKEFKDIALFQHTLFTDTAGKVCVAIEYPGDITTWELKAYAIASKGRFDKEELLIESIKKQSMELKLPEYLVESDSLVFPVFFFNQDSDSLSVDYQVKFGSNTQELSSSNFINYKSTTSSVVADLDNQELTGLAKFSNGAFDGEKKNIKVYDASLIRTHRLTFDSRKDTVVTLPLGAIVEKTASLNALMYGIANQFKDYDYHCNEQEASMLLLDAIRTGKRDLKRENTILKNRNYYGLWSWYARNEGNQYVTFHVLNCLKAYDVLNSTNLYKTCLDKISKSIEGTSNLNSILWLLLYQEGYKMNFESYVSRVNKSEYLLGASYIELKAYRELCSKALAFTPELNLSKVIKPVMWYNNLFEKNVFKEVVDKKEVFKLMNFGTGFNTYTASQLMYSLINSGYRYQFQKDFSSESSLEKTTDGKFVINHSDNDYFYLITYKDTLENPVKTGTNGLSIATELKSINSTTSKLYITLNSSSDLEYLMINIPLPASHQMKYRMSVEEGSYYIDPRQNEVRIYLQGFPNHSKVITLELEPKFSGKFTQKAAFVFDMYGEDTFANESNKQVIVK